MGAMSDDQHDPTTYAPGLAQAAYDWYQVHANRARVLHWTSEVTVLVVAAAIPVAAVISPDDALAPAILGAVLVVLTGLRTIFHWHENYIRFAASRERIKAEQRAYRVRAAPYDDLFTRDQVLVAAISRIEGEDLGEWVEIASPRSGQD
jgi:hypothetical protein